MKVEKRQQSVTPQRTSDDSARNAVRGAAPSFGAVLGQNERKMQTDVLWKALEEQAERLKRKIDLVELRRYQEQVRRFLLHITGNAYEFKESMVRDRRGRRKPMSKVDLIDDKMEDLASMVVSEEKDRLAILEKIDEIRGILIDLKM